MQMRLFIARTYFGTHMHREACVQLPMTRTTVWCVPIILIGSTENTDPKLSGYGHIARASVCVCVLEWSMFQDTKYQQQKKESRDKYNCVYVIIYGSIRIGITATLYRNILWLSCIRTHRSNLETMRLTNQHTQTQYTNIQAFKEPPYSNTTAVLWQRE